MTHDPLLLDYLESAALKPWEGIVFRYTVGGREPDRENTMGARWNPPGLGAIYTALARETALAELHHFVSGLVPVPSRMVLTLYEIHLSLQKILDLGSTRPLRQAGLTDKELSSPDFGPCQRVGAAAQWLGAGGLLVPSARDRGTNLVVYPSGQPPDYEFEVLSSEPLELRDVLRTR
jgi:RES domain-containing protein